MRLAVAIVLALTTVQGVQARELTGRREERHCRRADPAFSRSDLCKVRMDAVAGRGFGRCGRDVLRESRCQGAGGSYEGYVPYLAAVLVRSGKIADAVLIGTNYPSPARRGSLMRQCLGKVGD
jgi:hypothetical protein